MSSATPSPELTGPPASDVPAVLAACEQRVLEREGIAMFVALHDARAGRELMVADPVGLVEGPLLAGLFDHYASALDNPGHSDAGRPPEPSATGAGSGVADDPTGAAPLIQVLVVLSDQHLRSRAMPGPGNAAGT